MSSCCCVCSLRGETAWHPFCVSLRPITALDVILFPNQTISVVDEILGYVGIASVEEGREQYHVRVWLFMGGDNPGDSDWCLSDSVLEGRGAERVFDFGWSNG